MRAEGSLLARMMLPVFEVAKSYGLPLAKLQSFGFVPEELARLDSMLSSQQVYRLLEQLAPLVDLETFAMDVAQATSAGDLGPLGLALRAAPNGRAALDLVVRYQRAINTLAGFHLLDGGAEMTLAEDRAGPDGPGRLIAAEITTLTNVHWGRKLFGPTFRPIRINLPRRSNCARYSEWAGCPCVAGAAHAGVVFSPSYLEQLLPQADTEVWRFMLEMLEERSGVASKETTVRELRAALAPALSGGEPSLADMAQRLGQTPRTLQRKLSQEGTSYSAVLDELRHELALAHLGRQQLAIAEIAFALGFDEVASFHRAFRRWRATTPAAYRQSVARA